MATLATHIVFTAYGTWLPGDDRGHWSPLFDFYGHLLRKGHQLNIPDPITAAVARANLVDEPKWLQFSERALASVSFMKHFRYPNLAPSRQRYTVSTTRPSQSPPRRPIDSFLKPLCYAAAIEENHVHILLGPLQKDIDRFVGRLKGTSSAELKKLPQNKLRRHLWTASFWRVFVYDSTALQAIRQYIIAHNLRRGISPDPHPFITPI